MSDESRRVADKLTESRMTGDRGLAIKSAPLQDDGGGALDFESIELIQTPLEPGIVLPHAQSANPMNLEAYIDNRIEGAAWSIYTGGPLLWIRGLDIQSNSWGRISGVNGSVWVPDWRFRYGKLALSPSSNFAVFDSMEDADRQVPAGPAKQGEVIAGFARVRGGLIAPTVFCSATTPRIVSVVRQAQATYAQNVQNELTVIAITLMGTIVSVPLSRAVQFAGRKFEEALRAKPATARRAPSFASQQQKARELVSEARENGARVVVNIGGAGAPHEPREAINVNNQVLGRKNIPKLVEADGTRVGELFDPSSVDRIEGHNMAPEAIDWRRAAPGAFRILKPGGTLYYYYRGANADAKVAEAALKQAGFERVNNISDAILEATKP